MHDRGLPTWLDINDLASEPTEAAIRAALNDENTSGAILWLTPDVKESPVIRDIEVPEAVRRRRQDSTFWLIVILAGGLDYADVRALFARTLGGEDLSVWNLTKVASPRAIPSDIKSVAVLALKNRIAAIAKLLDSPRVLYVGVHARGTMVRGTQDALTLDWTEYFADGVPNASDWESMSDAARDVARLLKQETAPDTAIAVGGTPSLPASILIGSTFSGRDRRPPTWLQLQPNGSTITEWSMTAANDGQRAQACGWRTGAPTYLDTAANALAVCVSLSENVSGAFAASPSVHPDLRGIVRIEPPEGRNTRAEPLTAEEAASLVHLTIDAIRDFRQQAVGLNSIHVFIAAPAGFAFLLGTRLATLPAVVTYEYMTATAKYSQAVTIHT
ncbi:SAVED domain-containing protein [Mycolicibacterium stellerae]|uniref:SAVED domain-containing protein n=1 Tax=Mycolicibacterium stellerae TaxID=2358193 RepID=UPI0013DE715D|nr:SAVED domain-containing protein [Mycolicibacterium stellerae]